MLPDVYNRAVWRMQDSANHASIEHRATGARVRVIGSDPRRAHGLRSKLILCDEPSQWEPAKSDKMLAALSTSLGKVPGSRMIWLGTKPDSSSHFFARILEGGADYTQIHAASKGDPKFLLRTIRKSNPSYDHMGTLRERLGRESQAARKDASMLPAWEALRLNLGVSDTHENVLLDADTWLSIEGSAPPTGRCYWGIDLGTSAAQSAIAAYYPDSSRLDVLAAFPHEPGLAERGLRDGVGNLYTLASSRGELIQCGGLAVAIPELLRAALARFGRPISIASDRWREAELRDALKEVKIYTSIDLRGQGYKDGGEDVRGFRRACLEGRVTPVESLLMRSSMGEARTIMDPAGNSKLAKKNEGGRRQLARDDAAAASILAVASGVRIDGMATGLRYYGSA